MPKRGRLALEDMSKGGTLGFVPALNGVRGIAIVAVTSFHFFGLSGGFYGVDLFFVLSGFLITTVLLEERDATGRVALRSFYARRARRLLPALGTFLLAAAIFASAETRPGQLAATVASGAFYCLNIVGLLGHPGYLTGPLGHLWSLCQEEQFYAVWPVILIAALRKLRETQLMALLAAVFLALVAYRTTLGAFGVSWLRIYFAPDTHADGLVLGCFAALVRRRGIHLPPGIGWPALGAFSAAAALGSRTVAWSLFGLPLVELASATLLLSALEPGRFQSAFSRRPLVWVGALSYSLYLWQTQTAVWELWLLAAAAAPTSYYLIEAPFRRPRAPRREGVGAPRALPATTD